MAASSVAHSPARSLRNRFLPEMIWMNGVMAAMAAVSVPWKSAVPVATSPLNLDFWFVMSIALCARFLVAYPINRWLVENSLKHGMKTVMHDGTAPPLTAGLALAGATLARATQPGHNGDAVEDVSMDPPTVRVRPRPTFGVTPRPDKPGGPATTHNPLSRGSNW